MSGSSLTRCREGEREWEERELPVLCRLPSAAASPPGGARGGRLRREGTGEWAVPVSAPFRLLSEAERSRERDEVRVPPPTVTRRRFV